MLLYPSWSSQLAVRVSVDSHDPERGSLLRDDPNNQPSLLSKAYFSRYFDVTTRQVLWRLGRALMPFPLNSPIFTPDSKPDL